MTDYMKEAERLMRQYTTAVLEKNSEATAFYHSALLAHIQRGAVHVHCTPTEHEGRIVYEHTSEPIPNADGFVLYAPVPDQFRNAAKMMAVQPSCMTCTAPAPAEVPMPEPDWVTFSRNAEGVGVRVDSLRMEGVARYGAACRAAGEAAGYARGLADERERICAAIKAEDDYCVTEGDYMLDSDDCIRVARGTWERPDYALRAEVK